MGVNARQRMLFALLIAQGGEFAFVVIGAARMVGVLDRDTEGLLTIVVALSMRDHAATSDCARLVDGARRVCQR